MVEGVCLALDVDHILDVVDCGAVVDTLEQKEISDVRPLHSDLVYVFELSLTFLVLVLALNANISFFSLALEENVVSMVQFEVLTRCQRVHLVHVSCVILHSFGEELGTQSDHTHSSLTEGHVI